jgi:Uma2 family endonuclease
MSTHVSVNNKTDRELWTATDFLDWLSPGFHADLIDGERFMHSPVSLRHADLLNFLDRLLGSYIDKLGLGKLYREVVAVRLSARNVFLPDLAFFAAEQVPRLGATFASEAPALVAEALSDWSADRDVGPKFAEYERAGVQEYWVLDPETLAHRFYRKAGEIFVEFAVGDPVIRSEVVNGFWMERSWLDPDHLPKVAVALARLTDQSSR